MAEVTCQRLLGWLLTHLLQRLRRGFEASSLCPSSGHLSYPSQQHWSRALPPPSNPPFFSYMLTGYLTTGDFVRLTNRPPFPSLMSFEHFTAIWPAVLEPQREWSMMETPYKKKINQTHFNSNIVREGTVAWMRDVKDNTFDTRGGVKIHYEFLWRKKLLTFSFPRPVCVIRPLTPLLPFAPCVVCLMSCSVASRLQGLALQVGVISLLATAVKRKTVESSFSLYTPTPTQRLWL